MVVRRASSTYEGWWTRFARTCTKLCVSGLALSPSPGCSLILDSDKQQCRTDEDCSDLFGVSAGYACKNNFCSRPACKTDEDCLGHGSGASASVCLNSYCQADLSWSCLDAPAPPSNLPGPFAVKLPVVDTVTQAPLPGVTARVCDKLDFDCAAPQSTQLTDDNGEVALEIPAFFYGYVSLTLGGYKEGLFFFGPPIDRDTSDLNPISLGPPAVHMLLAEQTGATLMPERGILLIEALNCQHRRTAGVSYETSDKDELSVPFYSNVGRPDTNATATDSYAFGGYINMPPGVVTVTGRLRERQRTLGTVQLVIKPDAITYGRMVPTGN